MIEIIIKYTILQKINKPNLFWDKKEFKEIYSDRINIKNELWTIYNNLLHNDVIKKNDVDILNVWSNYFE